MCDSPARERRREYAPRFKDALERLAYPGFQTPSAPRVSRAILFRKT